jgi:hypothetical protein
MGEFADYALDEAMEAENDRWLYRSGALTDKQAFELGIIDHLGRYAHRPMFASQPAPKVCKHCGASGLVWRETPRGWRLYDSDGIHTCAQYRAS